MKIDFDIDIDFSDRNLALQGIEHVSASMVGRNGRLEKHNTGVYFHTVPQDPVTRLASLPYKQAEQHGYFKIDLLNVHVYENVKNEAHLVELINAPFDWSLMKYPEFVAELIHLHNHAELISQLRPTNIPELAMSLALIRPGKQHLIEDCIAHGFSMIKKEIWEPSDRGYVFKKSHSFGYAVLVKVHAQLLLDEIGLS